MLSNNLSIDYSEPTHTDKNQTKDFAKDDKARSEVIELDFSDDNDKKMKNRDFKN
jgi:hypothetical protein